MVEGLSVGYETRPPVGCIADCVIDWPKCIPTCSHGRLEFPPLFQKATDSPLAQPWRQAGLPSGLCKKTVKESVLQADSYIASALVCRSDRVPSGKSTLPYVTWYLFQLRVTPLNYLACPLKPPLHRAAIFMPPLSDQKNGQDAQWSPKPRKFCFCVTAAARPLCLHWTTKAAVLA